MTYAHIRKGVRNPRISYKMAKEVWENKRGSGYKVKIGEFIYWYRSSFIDEFGLIYNFFRQSTNDPGSNPEFVGSFTGWELNNS